MGVWAGIEWVVVDVSLEDVCGVRGKVSFVVRGSREV